MAKAKPPVGRPFAKGNPGRKPGSKNKVTVLREGLMAALNLEGGVEYLRQQAREHPKAFLAALARANPAQLEIEHRGSIEHEHKLCSRSEEILGKLTGQESCGE